MGTISHSTGVSIVTHRTGPQQLANAVNCVLRSPAVASVTIVDNSPDDRLRHTAAAIGEDRLGYIHTENRGFGAGHNIAIRQSLAESLPYHLVMNADIDWEGDVISAMARFMLSQPDAGMAMPRVRYPDGVLQYACRLLPTPWDVFAKRFLPHRLIAARLRRYLLADADHNRQFNPPYLLGSFLFFRCDALREAGLFDERFFMYPEDIDITRRIHARRPTLFFPGAEITHYHAAASRHDRRMLKIHITNMCRYFCKWGWFFDRERRDFNRRMLNEMPRSPRPEKGRG